MQSIETDDGARDAASAATEPNTGWALAGFSAGAGVIHFAMTPIHASTAWQESLGFAAAGWFQLATAALILTGRGNRRLYQLAVLANLAFIGVWAYSRTAGLPFGENPGVGSDIGAIDASAVALQVGVVLVGLRMWLAPEQRSVGRLAPALSAIAALGLVTAVITSPDAANHNHGSKELTGLAKAVAEVDETRCDTKFNPPSYWEEAATVGVDTRWAGAPPAGDGAMSADGHAHGATAVTDTSTTLPPDPNDGRGSPGLDTLVSATDLAAKSEIEAANLIAALSNASDEDYDAWLWWLRSSGSLAHEHSATFTAEDGSGHGGHVGPQPWKAITNQKDCDRLEKELDRARETALSYPTAQDAMDDGYRLVAPYLPGIASHFIKGQLIDGTFEIEKPEMLLYDGNSPDSQIVGLSYYIFHRGDTKPTQGFTGDNDSGHRHIGLCSAPGGGIIGDSSTTEEECAASGGVKSDGGSGWMSHAWVVPGCESPWGVFSAATPVLDDDLGAARADGSGGPGCAGAGVRERYGLDDAPQGEGESAAKADQPSATAGG